MLQELVKRKKHGTEKERWCCSKADNVTWCIGEEEEAWYSMMLGMGKNIVQE